MNNLEKIIKKVKKHDAVIGVIGLGYVGIPLALRFYEKGMGVIGLDIDKQKIELLTQQKSYIEHIKNDRLPVLSEKWKLTSDYKSMSEADAIILCVPTPLNKNREPDISYVTNTMDSVKPFLREGQIVSLESTTYPGTTEEEILPRIEEGGLKVGETVFLVYSPEREDPGNKDFSTHTIPKIVGGHTKACLEAGKALYGDVIDYIVPVSSTQTAEMTKLLENIHRTVNIGLVNEMKIVCDSMGINIHEVINAAATKPFGFTPYYPGPGLGGHCIPIDPFYLTWKAKEYGISTRFIELSGEINRSMPNYVVSKLSEALNKCQKSMNGSKVLILGIAYKKNVDDTRESPSIEIMEILRDKGVLIHYSDPHVSKFPKMRDHEFNLNSVEITPLNLKGYDAVMVLTDHDAFDMSIILEHSDLIIDTRGVYAGSDYLENLDVINKVVKA